MTNLRESSGWAVTHHPCDMCGSKDNASTNHDGWVTCFGCGERYKSGSSLPPKVEKEKVVTMVVGKGEYKRTRCIDALTCERAGS